MNLSEALQEPSGGTSSSRVAMLLTVGAVILIWGAATITGALSAYEAKTAVSIPDIPWGVVTLALGLSAAKTVQRKFEESDASSAAARN